MKSLRFLLPFCLFLLVSNQSSAQDCPDSCFYYIPNSITPDCDDFGCEILQITSSCPFTEFDFTIYNRWGEVIFHSDHPKNKFDCRDSAEGTYFWVFKGQYCNDQRFSDTGNIMVLK
jgi:hypothetical protein